MGAHTATEVSSVFTVTIRVTDPDVPGCIDGKWRVQTSHPDMSSELVL